jgi:DNA-directed RNA polymerase specialized sigma24 family protein
VPADFRDDVVQETGLRLFRSWERVRPESQWAFALTIATNIIRDEIRKQGRGERIHSAAAELCTEGDVEHEAMVRLELERVRRALDVLGETQRTLLLAEVGEASTVLATAGSAVKMARMRARKRLRSILDDVSAIVIIKTDRLRRHFDEFDSSIKTAISSVAVHATAAVTIGATAVGPVLSEVRPPVDVQMASMTPSTADGISVRSAVAEMIGVDHERVRDLFRVDAASQVVGPTHGLRKNIVPVRTDGKSVAIGGGEPESIDVERSVGGRAAGDAVHARARARYETPDCDEVVVGAEPNASCKNAGQAYVSAETQHGEESDAVEASTYNQSSDS